MKLTNQWPVLVVGSAAAMAVGRVARASGLTMMREMFGRRSGAICRPSRSQNKQLNGIGIAQDGIGGFEFLAHFVGFQGALGKAGAVFLFPSHVEVPASV